MPINKIKVFVTTVTGSITGDARKPVCVDDSLTVHKFKMFVQDHVEHTPLVQRGNPNMKILKGVSPDFQRLLLDNVELENDSKTLQECGVKQGSMLSFAVDKMLGNKLRRAMLGLEDAPMNFSVVGDCEIMASVLENLKDRTLDPDKREGSLRDALYGVLNPNFDKIEGVHDGCLTLNKERGEEKSGYIHWAVDEEIKGACPFKTYYGIPVYPRVYTRQKQHLVGEPQRVL